MNSNDVLSPDGGNLWKLKVLMAAKGVVILNSDGQFSYKPEANYFELINLFINCVTVNKIVQKPW